MMELFAACAPGLESLLAEEVRALAVEPVETAGGVAFSGDLATLYRANLELGLALKVLVRLARFNARDFSRLERGAAAVDWPTWIGDGASVRVRATCRKSRLYHSGAVAERIERAIGNAANTIEPTESAAPTFEVHARVTHDECVLSVDTSGVPLHKRGYRQATGKAPLREDLARALLKCAGWDRRCPVVDPFCGAGTILIEAGILAANIAPGWQRRFAFVDAANFDAELWQRVRRAADERRESAVVQLFGSDRDAGVVALAEQNSARADIKVQVDCAPLSKAPAWQQLGATQAPCLIATNPPYGSRVSRGRQLEPLYHRLAHCVGELANARLALVAADGRLVSRAKLPVTRAVTTDHGGKKVGLYVAKTA